MADDKHEIGKIRKRIEAIDAERRNLTDRLQALEGEREERSTEKGPQQFTPAEKIDIFRQLFRGREDVFPKRWENSRKRIAGYSPACANEWVRGVCGKPKVKCSECPDQAFIEVSDDVLRSHLTGNGADGGRGTIGVYPLLPDDRCWFLAADFDGDNWRKDAAAFLETCRGRSVPAQLERSRSGNGGHVWIFFSAPVHARDARAMGAYLLTETMEHHPDLAFSSYDRFFPNQDSMPAGGFGNLIALPLQHGPRKQGNSVFLDGDFEPHPDQWAFLASVKRMAPEDVEALALEAAERGRVTGLRIPVDDEDAKEPWKARPSRKPRKLEIAGPLPVSVTIVMGNQIYIEREGLPPQLVNRLIRAAAFQNPEFYKAQAMRLPVFDKPRIIACAENHPDHIGLPRGCLDDVAGLLDEVGVAHEVIDKRYAGKPIRTKFLGKLDKEQKLAAKALLGHDIGVLSAATGFGKTVVAANAIARRKRNTLVLVHRKQLLEQWMSRLGAFLDTTHVEIGRIGGGGRKPSGQIDIATIQSLVRKGEVKDCVGDYGHLVVDECHHLSAVSFEAVARQCKAKYILGLTATPTRKDGHHPIIFMQCGPVRHHVDARKQARKRPFDHFVVPRYTEFRLSETLQQQYERPPIQKVYAELALDTARNEMIVADVVSALKNGRSPVLLTERREHVDFFADRLSGHAKHVVALQGGKKGKAHRQMMEELEKIGEDEERVLVATGRYIGEGFDDSRLDTLFLAMPVSWKGTLSQYAGRLHRIHHGKSEVRVYDYIDRQVPVLQRMSDKRMSGYRSLGYEVRAGYFADGGGLLDD